MADLELVEGDSNIEQQFVLTAEGDPIDITDASAITWFTFRRPDDLGATVSTAASVLNSATGFCTVTLPAAHMDKAGNRRCRVRVSWLEFTQDQWFPSDRALELTVLPHTRLRT